MKFPYQLPPLPYAYKDLEPYIDAKTMEIHHLKHHQAYIDNLNRALENYPDLQKKSLEELMVEINNVPAAIRQKVINHGGGHLNHSLFWEIMAPKGGGSPSGELAKIIELTFGSFQNFKDEFTQQALNRFGSGWAWLVVGSDKKLKIYSTPNQDSPLIQGDIPILGLDVWEHAYYLKYQNRRQDYIFAWWNVVNWQKVAEYYSKYKQ
jgi:Fe-Mn family superoxide dismutase